MGLFSWPSPEDHAKKVFLDVHSRDEKIHVICITERSPLQNQPQVEALLQLMQNEGYEIINIQFTHTETNMGNTAAAYITYR